MLEKLKQKTPEKTEQLQANFPPTALVLLAAGSGSRTGSVVKKQHIRLAGKALWQLVLKRFLRAAKRRGVGFCRVIVVGDEARMMAKMQPQITVVQGGATRCESIAAALCELASAGQNANLFDAERVLISDVARCFVGEKLIEKMLFTCEKDCEYPAIGCADTARKKDGELLERAELELVQTPQNSNIKNLAKALFFGQISGISDENLKNVLRRTNIQNGEEFETAKRQIGGQNDGDLPKIYAEFSDESSAIAAAGGQIRAHEGELANKKLTTEEDLRLLADEFAYDGNICATGCGFDVHEFCASELGSATTEKNFNARLVLGGVDCGEMGLKAHSDGDVLAHAVMDALLGAACLGDIGEIFCEKDARWRGASSMQMLQIVTNRLASVGLEPAHISAQIIAQKPRIGALKAQMEQNLAKVCGCAVNVAASTTEKLGDIGRGAGIAVIVNCSLRAKNFLKSEEFW